MTGTLLGPFAVAPAYPHPFACIICIPLLRDHIALEAAVAQGCPGRDRGCSQATGTLPAIQRWYNGGSKWPYQATPGTSIGLATL